MFLELETFTISSNLSFPFDDFTIGTLTPAHPTLLGSQETEPQLPGGP